MKRSFSILFVFLCSMLWAFEPPSPFYNGSVDVIGGNYVEYAEDICVRGLEPLKVVRGVCGAVESPMWNLVKPQLITFTDSLDGLDKVIASDLEGNRRYLNSGEYLIQLESGEKQFYSSFDKSLLKVIKPNGHCLEIDCNTNREPPHNWEESFFRKGCQQVMNPWGVRADGERSGREEPFSRRELLELLDQLRRQYPPVKENPSIPVGTFDNLRPVEKVVAWNSDKSQMLGWLKYKDYYEEEDSFFSEQWYTVTASDGQEVRYTVDSLKRLNEVSVLGWPTTQYTYDSYRIARVQRRGNYLENSYYKEGPLAGRVYEQFAPVAPDGSRTRIATYDYQFDDPAALTGRTEVWDAYQNRTTFHYSNKRLAQIDRYQGADQGILTEYYAYASDGTLLGKAICDDHPLMATTLEYDERSNVVVERLWGDLTGENRVPLQLDGNRLPIDNGVDCYERRFLYYEEGNRLQAVIEGARRTNIFYWGETDLEERRLVSEGERIVESHCYRYDKNGSLIEYTWEKGGQRRIRRTTPVVSGSAIGLPKRVEEWYWEGEERLLGAIEYAYDKRNLVTSETVFDASGTPRYALKREYDQGARLVSITDPLGQKTLFSYNSEGQLISEVGPHGRKSHSYDCAGRRIATRVGSSDEESQAIHYRYDLLNNCIEIEDSLGSVETQFDSLGRPLSQRLPGQQACRFAYNGLGQPISEENGAGEVVRRRYTARGDLAEELFPDGTSNRYIYSLSGGLLRTVARNGVETDFSYEGGHLISLRERSPDGLLQREVSLGYEGDSLVYTCDGEGNECHFEYDGAGRLVVERCGESRIGYKYDALGRVCCTILATGSGERREEWREYDLLNRITEEWIQDGEGRLLHWVSYSYDERGNRTEVVTEVNGVKQVKRTEHDGLNRPIRIVDELGNQTVIEYRVVTTSSGRLTERVVTDPLGGMTITRTDSLGNALSVERVDPFGVTLSHIEMSYDRAGRLIERRTALISVDGRYGTHTVSWRRGVMGRIEEVNEGGRRSQFFYNSLGQVVAKRLPSGETVYYTYDGLGRLLCEKADDYSYRFFYDANHNIVRVVDESGRETVRRFDQHNWLTSETQSSGLTLTYSRDYLGRPTEIGLPEGAPLAFCYDALGVASLGRKGQYEHRYVERDCSGRVLKERLIGNAGEVHRRWTPTGGVEATQGGGLSEELHCDPLGRIIERQVNGERQRFGYDGLSQLKTETGRGELRHLFNSIGNRNRTDAAYNAQNELVGEEYKFDANGCLTGAPDRTARFDARGRLIEVTVDGKCYQYAYDCFDRRIEEKCEGGQILYLYDGQAEIAAFREGRLRQLRLLGEGIASDIGAIVAVEIDGTPYAVRSDYRGSVSALLDLSGHLVEEYRYSAFGEEESGGICPWRFSSKRVDTSGLIYFGCRHYDPALGRWISPDPLGFSSGSNLYLYCDNDPINKVDPYGLSAVGFGEFGGDPFRGPKPPMVDRKPLPKPLPDPRYLPPPSKFKPENKPPVVNFRMEPPHPPRLHRQPPQKKGQLEPEERPVAAVSRSAIGYAVAVENSRMISQMAIQRDRAIRNALNGLMGKYEESRPYLERNWFAPGRAILQTLFGAVEVSVGGGLSLTPSAPLGWFLIAHGGSQCIAGGQTLITGTRTETLGCRGLQAAGLPPNWAEAVDGSVAVAGTAVAGAVLRGAAVDVSRAARFPTTYQEPVSAVRAVSRPVRQYRMVGDFTYSRTTAKHYFESVIRGPNGGRLARPFMRSPLTVEEIMKSRAPMPDPRGTPGTLYWEVPGTFRGSEGAWELLIHPETNIIYHFNFE